RRAGLRRARPARPLGARKPSVLLSRRRRDGKHEKSRFRHEVVTHPCGFPTYARAMSDRTNGRARDTRAKSRKVTTPWGPAALREEVVLHQRAGEHRFSSHVQLLG